MVYIYKECDKVLYSRTFVEMDKVIELERMIPRPNKPGFKAVLNADFEAGKAWYNLVPLLPTIEEVRADKIAEIAAYDKSEYVNSFVCADMPMWLDKATRTSLAYTIEVEAACGNEITRFWYESQPPISFDLPISLLKGMLAALEQYAKATYDVTQNHKKNVYALETVEDIENYDHTAGYPEKLVFEL